MRATAAQRPSRSPCPRVPHFRRIHTVDSRSIRAPLSILCPCTLHQSSFSLTHVRQRIQWIRTSPTRIPLGIIGILGILSSMRDPIIESDASTTRAQWWHAKSFCSSHALRVRLSVWDPSSAAALQREWRAEAAHESWPAQQALKRGKRLSWRRRGCLRLVRPRRWDAKSSAGRQFGRQ